MNRTIKQPVSSILVTTTPNYNWHRCTNKFLFIRPRRERPSYALIIFNRCFTKVRCFCIVIKNSGFLISLLCKSHSIAPLSTGRHCILSDINSSIKKRHHALHWSFSEWLCNQRYIPSHMLWPLMFNCHFAFR